MRNKFFIAGWLFVLISVFSFSPIVSAQQLGASLYFAPLEQNPKNGGNFTLTAKVDSLAQPINAIKASLKFNTDKLEIISISKIGSIINLWVEEPRYSNIDGALSFQGGVPNPGFTGNGGIVLYIIFHVKAAGVTTLSWIRGEVLANDGKGTNILTNLQNIDFEIGEDIVGRAPLLLPALPPEEIFNWSNPLVLINIVLLFVLLIIGLIALIHWILKNHDREFHEHHEEHDPYDDHSNIHKDDNQT